MLNMVMDSNRLTKELEEEGLCLRGREEDEISGLTDGNKEE